MDERKAPGYYGMRVGLISGLFSILQVVIAAAALQGARAELSAYYATGSSIGIIALFKASTLPMTTTSSQIPSLSDDIGGLISTTILSTVLLGIATLVFAWYAGRLTATAIGYHRGGASAGSTVWWVSSLIWIVASLVGAAVTSPGGNLIDILSSYVSLKAENSFNPNFFPLGFIFLLALDVLVALIGWGLCAAAGAMGASSAPLGANAATRAPGMLMAPLGATPMGMVAYPPAPGYPLPPNFPPAGAYPPQAYGAPRAGVYPPPPGYYAPPQLGQTTPRPPSTAPTTPATPDTPPASNASATTGDD